MDGGEKEDFPRPIVPDLPGILLSVLRDGEDVVVVMRTVNETCVQRAGRASKVRIFRGRDMGCLVASSYPRTTVHVDLSDLTFLICM